MTPPTNDNGRATNKQLLDAIQDLTIKVEVMTSKLENEIKKTDTVIGDHETRIRSLEKLVWTSSWISSGVSTVITAVAVLFFTKSI